jgi:hypothetical protein
MQLHISDQLLNKYPHLSKGELRAIIKVIWNYKSAKLKTSHTADFTIPHFGRIKSHGNKKKRKYRLYDKKKKRRRRLEKSMTKEKLLF